MYDLETIIARNRQAVRDGIVKAGQLVGTVGVEPDRYTVTSRLSGNVLAKDLTATEVAAKFNSFRSEVLVDKQETTQ